MVQCTTTDTTNLMLDSLELEPETEILVKVIYLGSALRKGGRKSGQGRGMEAKHVDLVGDSH